MEYEKSPNNIFYRMMLEYAYERWMYYDELLQQVGRYSPQSEELDFLAGEYYNVYVRYNTLWIHYDSYDIVASNKEAIQ